jgi:hypothetical protein
MSSRQMSLTGLFLDVSISVILLLLLLTNRTPEGHSFIAEWQITPRLAGKIMDSRVLVSYSIFASALSLVSVSGFLLDVSLIVKVSPTFKGSATQRSES